MRLRVPAVPAVAFSMGFRGSATLQYLDPARVESAVQYLND